MENDPLYPLRRLHGFLYEEKQRMCKAAEYRKKYRQIFRRNPNTVFLCLTPEHSNMGDHAIAAASFDLLSSVGIQWIEITDQQLFSMDRENLLGVMNGYPILICGGGNLGTLWMNLETIMRKIVKNNPRSPIAILPNTIYYEDTPRGNQELERSRQIYNRHRKLRIYAREKTSFEFMRRLYRDVRLVPDMVLSMDRSRQQEKRSGCILCLRSDLEKTLTPEQEDILRQQARSLFVDQVRDSDMVLPGSFSISERGAMVQKKLDEFSSAQLVITDRLHGMIFCAITGTPCIVIDSKSPKVRGCYEWIDHLEYIRFADDVSHIGKVYRSIPEGPHFYQNDQLLPYFRQLAEDIRTIIK